MKDRMKRRLISNMLIASWLLMSAPLAHSATPDWGRAGQDPGTGEGTQPPPPSPRYERPPQKAPQPQKPTWGGTKTGAPPPVQTSPSPSRGVGQPSAAERPKAVLSTPQSVPYGNGLVLDGSRSSAAAGRKIVKYRWLWVNRELGAETSGPSLEVAFTDKNPIPTGVNQFRLAVEDDRGNRSEPVSVQVIVQKPPVQKPLVEKERPQPSKREAKERPQPSKRKGEY